MKASEIIKELIELMRDYGDREVNISYDGGFANGSTVKIEKPKEEFNFIAHCK